MTTTAPNSNSTALTTTSISYLPLFNSLYEACKNRTSVIINEAYNKVLHDTLNSLKIEQMEQALLIILHFHITILKQDPFRIDINAKARSQKMPYNMKCGSGGKGLSFSIDEMPNILKLILGEYCLIN